MHAPMRAHTHVHMQVHMDACMLVAGTLQGAPLAPAAVPLAQIQGMVVQELGSLPKD